MIIFSQGANLPFIHTGYVGLAMLFRTTPFYIYSHFINTYHHVLM